MIDVVLPEIATLFSVGTGGGFINKETERVMLPKFVMIRDYLNESMSTNLSEMCHASIVEKEQHHDTSMNTNMTCDITKQKYERSKIKSSFNSTAMLSLVFALFCGSIVLFGDYESFHFIYLLCALVVAWLGYSCRHWFTSDQCICIGAA